MKAKMIVLLGIVAILGFAGITSCNKDRQTAHLQLRLIDAPSPYAYESIYLDIREVQINFSEESSRPGWTTVHSASGVYDMLSLVNGVDVLLADNDFPESRIEQVRLILGGGNTIVVNGQSHPLTIPSGSESGLKINVHEDLEAGEDFTLILDFDAAKSIEQTGNGEYKLKPVIRGFVEQKTGAIRGVTRPAQWGTAVIADNGTQQFSTFADKSTGQFLLRGLPEGTYTVRIYYRDSDHAIVYEDIVVHMNEVTLMPQ